MSNSADVKRPIEYLAELYVVVAALALTNAVELLVDDATGAFAPSRLPTCFAVLFTLVPFFHGALRHLDITHHGEDRHPSLILWDFVLLFIEACVLLIAATLVATPDRVAAALAVLWIVDVLWIEVGNRLSDWRPPEKMVSGSSKPRPRWWAIINIPAALLAMLLAVIPIGPSVASWSLFVLCGVRTVADYWKSASYYFPNTTKTVN